MGARDDSRAAARAAGPPPRRAWLIAGFALAVAALGAGAAGAPPTLPPVSGWLLAAPVLLLAATARALRAERRSHARLAFLHSATHALSRSSDVEGALLAMLARSQEGFGADLAEVVLLPPGSGPPHRTRIAVDGSAATIALEPESADAARRLAGAEGGGDARIVGVGRTSRKDAYLAGAGVRGPAMLAGLHSDERPLGFILIGRPARGRFSADDLELLTKLASTVAATLAHESLEQDVGRLEELRSQLEHMAFHDPLTGLANRLRFTEGVTDALARPDALVAALYIDLDDFKAVNDSLGHRAGDELLLAVADRLRASLRAQDTPARLGGDEFAVLVDGAESLEVVLEVAERILAAVSEPFAVADGEVRIQASIGVATSREGGRRADDLLRHADLAMYRAKGQGKGCVELYEAQMHADALERSELKSELQSAIDAKELFVVYQPVVDLGTGRIAGVEALVRWKHPRLGTVSPDAFIGHAEEAGLISGIGRMVLDTACARLAAWRQAGTASESFSLSLNLSAREFAGAELVESLTGAVVAAGVPTGAVTLEITELALMADSAAGGPQMQALKAAGFRLALDDFGTGASSLSDIRRFPIDILKVAKPFVDHIAERPEDSDFLRSILDLARSLSLEVVVEGVETPAQARVLLELGVSRVQGFVFSRPVEDWALSGLLTMAPLRGFSPQPGDRTAVPALSR